MSPTYHICNFSKWTSVLCFQSPNIKTSIQCCPTRWLPSVFGQCVEYWPSSESW